jgi:two-component system, LytTR family, response regulator
MITCIAIDDEPLALQLLSDYASRTEGLNLLKTFTNPLDALKYLKNYAVDLLLLDIQMPDISGISFYKEVEQYSMVIFTTAYSEYAVEGFNVQAVDYLLKPIEYDRFLIAINKAIDFKNYLHLDAKSNEKCIHVRSEYSLIKIFVKDIEYIESFDDFIKIHISKKKPVITLLSLKAIQEMLPYELFMRIHRSYIIPLNQVRSVRHNRIMLQNIELPLGIRYREEFMMWFKATNE